MKNNKGYSLVELIIVVAIISVLAAGVTMSISVIYNTNAKACANSIRDTIADIKVLAMRKDSGSVRVHIYKDAQGCLYTQQQISDSAGHWTDYQDENRIGKNRVDVKYLMPGETNEKDIDEIGIYLSFDRSSGSFMDSVDDDIIIPEQIIVRGGNSVNGSGVYRLILHDLTGKVEIE